MERWIYAGENRVIWTIGWDWSQPQRVSDICEQYINLFTCNINYNTTYCAMYSTFDIHLLDIAWPIVPPIRTVCLLKQALGQPHRRRQICKRRISCVSSWWWFYVICRSVKIVNLALTADILELWPAPHLTFLNMYCFVATAWKGVFPWLGLYLWWSSWEAKGSFLAATCSAALFDNHSCSSAIRVVNTAAPGDLGRWNRSCAWSINRSASPSRQRWQPNK